MPDYVVDFLLGTGDMKKVLSDAKGGVSGGGGISSGAGGKGLKVAGVLGILGIISQMKVVQETITFLVTIMSTGLAFLISMFVQWITPFFKDPKRFLLELFIDQANMVIGVLEFMTNAILGALTFGRKGGFGENQIEFPRFQKDIILAAYDNMIEVINSSETGIGDVAVSVLDFSNSFIQSFMTNTEHAQLIEDSANTNFNKVINSIDKTGSLADDIQNAYDKTKRKLDNLFSSGNSRTTFTPFSGPTTFEPSNQSALEITRQYNESLNFGGRDIR